MHILASLIARLCRTLARPTVLASITLLMTFSPFSLFAQEIDQDIDQQITELEELYTEIEQQLHQQSEALDKALTVGYGGTAIRKDMGDIADRVEGLATRLSDLGEQLSTLIKNMNINPIKPFTIIPRRGAKDAPPLQSAAHDGDRIYFTAEVPHPPLEDGSETELIWSLKLPDGRISEKLKKTDISLRDGPSALYSFGINTTGMELGAYEITLTHTVVGRPKHTYLATASFDINQIKDIKIIRMVVDDERTGDKHQPVLAEGAAPFLFSYYEVPAEVTALSARYRVRDLTDRKDIYQKSGRRNTKPEQDIQRVGIKLDPEKIPLTVGHEYRFDISFTDDLRQSSTDKAYDTVRDSITFFYGTEPRFARITRLGATVAADGTKFDKNIPLLTTPLYLNSWVTAAKSIDVLEVDIRLIRTKDKSVVFETRVSQKNDPEKGISHLSFPVDPSLLTEGAKYRQEVTVRVEGLEPVTARRSFTYAKKPPVDMAKYVKVSGVIRTPGLPDVIINSVPNTRYRYRHNSTITLSVPAVYPDGIDGKLAWRCKNCGGVKTPRIPLDGSNNDWGFSYSPGKNRWGGKIELFHLSKSSRSKNLYSAHFSLEKPFQASLFTSLKGRKKNLDFHPWGMGDIGVRLKANSFATTVTVSAKATLKETGETLFNETKSISLPANQDKDWLWAIDPDRLKFDLARHFPGIKKSHIKKNIDLEVTIDDGKGYKTSRSTALTRKIFILNDKKYFKNGPNNPENPLVRTIVPPADMKGPFTTSITGISTYYTEGLKWYYDPDKLESWAAEGGAKKYKEDDKKEYYRKTVPLLLTIEDSTGKQAVAFWKNYTYSVNIWKKPEAELGKE
ncbi:MAG: hypothetical protein COB54_01305 [Alphaproteobacteria bacterium]|nr:MAG: hypothetical protein COB54_01305 [Alphaproteobacteria bacterium]